MRTAVFLFNHGSEDFKPFPCLNPVAMDAVMVEANSTEQLMSHSAMPSHSSARYISAATLRVDFTI